jgi:hypothetical protein
VRFRSSCCLLVAARYGGLDGSFCWLVAAEVGVGRVYGVRGLLLRHGLSCIVRARLPESAVSRRPRVTAAARTTSSLPRAAFRDRTPCAPILRSSAHRHVGEMRSHRRQADGQDRIVESMHEHHPFVHEPVISSGE